MFVSCGRTTSASRTNVVVSDQFSTVAAITRPPFENGSAVTRVTGHGPAMQERRVLRNSFPTPASIDTPPAVAVHRPSGEQREPSSHGTLPVFATSKVLAALPTFVDTVASAEYRTRRWLNCIVDSGAGSASSSVADSLVT